MTASVLKHSYTVPCPSAFRDAVEALARRRRVNAGDLARSVMLVVAPEAIAAVPDPGEPAADDRETVVLKSGPAEGRPWRRKPRLQVRLPPGHDVAQIRRSLALALAIAEGAVAVRVGADAPPPDPKPAPEPDHGEEMERLRAVIGVLAFNPLPGGVRGRDEALHVLGFPPGAIPDQKTLRAKFRMLATIHHPDSPYGNHQRMSQLNEAIALLRQLA